jgi:ABC-type multidrug transport system fused ATPase/permease subunit
MAAAQSKKRNGSGRSAFRALYLLLRLTPLPFWSTAAIIVLGLLASFAETLGISLVVVFLYTAMDRQIDLGGVVGGMLGAILNTIGFGAGGGVFVALIIFLLILARALLTLTYNVICAEIGHKISEIARNSLHDQFLAVSYDFIRRHEQGELLEVLGTESWSVANAHASFTRLVINLCSILVFLTFLMVLSWRITLVAVIGGALQTLSLRWLLAPIRKLGAEVRLVNRALYIQMVVSLRGMRTIRAFAQETVHHGRFLKLSADARRLASKLDALMALLSPATEIGHLAVLCAIVAAGEHMQASFSTVLACVALLYRLQPHVREFEGAALEIVRLEPQLTSVLLMLDHSDKGYSPQGSRPVSLLKRALRFESVSFTYEPGRSPTLADASFSIPVGSITALVGASGAGKTTVVNLLLRLYQPDHGIITIDRVPLDEIARSDWLALVAVAGQDIDLVEGTIDQNIRMARMDASLSEVEEAIALADLSDFVATLPAGLDTWVGQQGLNLSGGQRQRIGIARALIRNAQLLILDEATSALDMEMGNKIWATLRARFQGKTILLLTHSLSTIISADHVIYVEDGLIREEGRPEDLLNEPAGALSRLIERSKAEDHAP